MWSNFFGRGEEGRGMGARQARRSHTMSNSKEGTVKLTLFLALSGVTLMVLALGTDYWAELSGLALPGNSTCVATYFGIWRQCQKTIETWEVEEGRETCGPVELPGVAHCSYFKFYTTGESAAIMGRKVEKDLFILLAVLSLLSLCLMILGTLSIMMALNRHPDFLIKLSSSCFIIAGLMVIASLVAFEEACGSMMRSNGGARVAFAHLWSFACAMAAAIIVLLSGAGFLLIVHPGFARRAAHCCQRKTTGA